MRLLEDAKNRFEYQVPLANVPNGGVNTSDLFFAATKSGNSITFRAPASTGGYLEQKYTLPANEYHLDYNVAANNLPLTQNLLRFNWVNNLGGRRTPLPFCLTPMPAIPGDSRMWLTSERSVIRYSSIPRNRASS